MKRAWLISFFLLLAGMSHGQVHSSTSKKALKQFDEAVALYQENKTAGAETALKKAIKSDERFIEAYKLLSQICYETGTFGRGHRVLQHYA